MPKGFLPNSGPWAWVGLCFLLSVWVILTAEKIPAWCLLFYAYAWHLLEGLLGVNVINLFFLS